MTDNGSIAQDNYLNPKLPKGLSNAEKVDKIFKAAKKRAALHAEEYKKGFDPFNSIHFD